jgi:hypothetical protein
MEPPDHLRQIWLIEIDQPKRRSRMSILKPVTLLTPADVADRLGISTATLATWRCTKRYPLSYVKVGRLVRYRIADLEAFEISRLQEVAANDN